MTTTPEALGSRKSPEPLPIGTAFQKVQELYRGLNVEALPFDDITEEKIANLKGGSWIRIAMITGGMPNNRALVFIVDNKTGISVQYGIFANGESNVRLSLPHKRIRVSGVAVPESYANHDIILKPEARDEERVMSDFVDWTGESLSEHTVTKPPYELEDVLAYIKSPRVPTSQLT